MAAGISTIVRLGRQVVIVVDMALRAGDRGVRVREWKTRDAVVECHAGPRRCVVTLRTICWGKARASFRVRRVIGLLPSRQMATRVPAVVRLNLQVIVVVDVALLAGNIRVAGSQREIDRWCSVISVEARAQPAIERGVAALAIAGAEIDGILGMWRIRGVLPVFQMARLALGGKAVKNPRSRLPVAVFTLNRRVSAEKREAVLVVFHLLSGDVPALYRVALLAVGSHLTAMDIPLFVAICAILSDILEHGFHVTGDALHFFVHSPQRIVGFVMVEFRYRPDGSPT